jgi:hypothetical protein
MVEKGLLKSENHDLLIVDHNIESLLKRMDQFIPKLVPKWLKADRT